MPLTKKDRISPPQLIREIEEPELRAIAGTESSFGRNLEHETIKGRSIHKGMTAGGPFGMMPQTAQYVYNKDKSLQEKHPWFADYIKDPKKQHTQITQILNDSPQLSYELAKSYLDIIKGRTGDVSEQFYRWNAGHNTQPSDKDLQTNQYVKETLRNLDRQKGISSPVLNVNKLLKLFGGSNVGE